MTGVHPSPHLAEKPSTGFFDSVSWKIEGSKASECARNMSPDSLRLAFTVWPLDRRGLRGTLETRPNLLHQARHHSQLTPWPFTLHTHTSLRPSAACRREGRKRELKQQVPPTAGTWKGRRPGVWSWAVGRGSREEAGGREMMVHDHRAHVTRAPTRACVCARVGERAVLHGAPRGFSRGLEGVGPARWDVRRLRWGNAPRKERLKRAQETRPCLGFKIHHPPRDAAPNCVDQHP